ncbi:hypothetical protein F0562_028288 [Nyssa sinensis]|uniref:Uncharacterized protein n=1 Tax=Nyssa sinensis TaxID=561372 RepID=A0A5J5B896_9ASTE|nr:hypothetical protein F0562_028288 [Nyssa sinensis]
MPGLGGPGAPLSSSYTFAPSSFGPPQNTVNVSFQYQQLSQIRALVGGQPWLSSGSQDAPLVTPLQQTGQPPSGTPATLPAEKVECVFDVSDTFPSPQLALSVFSSENKMAKMGLGSSSSFLSTGSHSLPELSHANFSQKAEKICYNPINSIGCLSDLSDTPSSFDSLLIISCDNKVVDLGLSFSSGVLSLESNDKVVLLDGSPGNRCEHCYECTQLEAFLSFLEIVEKKTKAKKLKKPKITVAEAATKDAADLATFLVGVSESYESQQHIQLMRFADYFSRAFSATSVDWINQRSYEALGSFVLWSLDSILANLASQQTGAKGSKKGVQQISSNSQDSRFVVLIRNNLKPTESIVTGCATAATVAALATVGGRAVSGDGDGNAAPDDVTPAAALSVALCAISPPSPPPSIPTSAIPTTTRQYQILAQSCFFLFKLCFCWILFIDGMTNGLNIMNSSVTLHPAVSGSILPTSVISLYCMYLCYSGLVNKPREYKCNGLHKHSQVVWTGTLTIGLLTTVLSVVYSVIRASSSTTLLSPPSSPQESLCFHWTKQMKRKRKKSLSQLHIHIPSSTLSSPLLVYAPAMLLTGWLTFVEESGKLVDLGWPSVWARILTRWATVALFIWLLLFCS